MNKEKQIEEMAKAIHDVAEAHHIIWCTELAKVLYNAGYRKASDVAREIFEEIEKTAIQRYAELNSDIRRTPEHAKSMFLLGEIKMLQNAFDFIAELKNKQIGADKNVTTDTEDGE